MMDECQSSTNENTDFGKLSQFKIYPVHWGCPLKVFTNGVECKSLISNTTGF